MVRYLFYTIGDLTYQSPLVFYYETMVIKHNYLDPVSLDRMWMNINYGSWNKDTEERRRQYETDSYFI